MLTKFNNVLGYQQKLTCAYTRGKSAQYFAIKGNCHNIRFVFSSFFALVTQDSSIQDKLREHGNQYQNVYIYDFIINQIMCVLLV